MSSHKQVISKSKKYAFFEMTGEKKTILLSIVNRSFTIATSRLEARRPAMIGFTLVLRPIPTSIQVNDSHRGDGGREKKIELEKTEKRQEERNLVFRLPSPFPSK